MALIDNDRKIYYCPLKGNRGRWWYRSRLKNTKKFKT
jgi:hypothetical protein